MVLNKLPINTKTTLGRRSGGEEEEWEDLLHDLCCSFTKIFVTGYFIIPSRRSPSNGLLHLEIFRYICYSITPLRSQAASKVLEYF